MSEAGREWVPAVSPAGVPHGESREVQRGWREAWCGSCGAYHHSNYLDCNGLRTVAPERCRLSLGEVYRCERPTDHLGCHIFRSGPHIEWRDP